MNAERGPAGFPGNGPYDVRAGRIGQTREVITQDAYGQGPVRRSITSLRGAVRSGNYGGQMVDKDGQVVTAGGRVAGVTAVAPNLEGAIARAYDAVSKISFDGMRYRKDIGALALARWRSPK